MANVQPKMVVTMEVAGACPSHARTDISVRDLVMSVDEPLARGQPLAACGHVALAARGHGCGIDRLRLLGRQDLRDLGRDPVHFRGDESFRHDT